MNSKDLQYIFSNALTLKKTEYPRNINIGTRSIQLNYLKNSPINFNSRDFGGKKFIDILRKDNSIITTISQNSYPTNSKSGIRLGMNKVLTEKHLENCNVRTTLSRFYAPNEVERAFNETFTDSDKRVVIKPATSTLGRGVMVDIGVNEFHNAWNYATKVKLKNKDIIVQEYVEGFEARATVIQGRLHSIVLRIPPYVKGNGRQNLKQLIERKNKDRLKHSHLRKALIQIDERVKAYLNSQNMNVNYIPQNGEYVLLASVSNFSLGGELMDITDQVTENIKNTALKALASMPNMYTGGLDMMMKSFDDEDPVVLEVNSYPALSLALYPTYGELSNPFEKYVESVITIDQLINPINEMYIIDNKKEYIRDILKFDKLRNETDYFRNDLI